MSGGTIRKGSTVAPDTKGMLSLNEAEAMAALALHEWNFTEIEGEDDILAARVTFAYDLMQQGRWHHGKTPKDLAKLWGCTAYYMSRTIEPEARRSFRRLIRDPEEATGFFLSNLEDVLSEVRHATNTIVTADGEKIEVPLAADKKAKAVVAIVSEASALLGLKAKKNGRDESDKRTLDDLVAQARQLLEETSIVTTGTELSREPLPLRSPLAGDGFGGDSLSEIED